MALAHSVSDRQLLDGMQKGDRAAMEQFYRRYSPYLYAVCLRYMASADDASDALQETFIKIFTSIKSFRYADIRGDKELTRGIKAWTARIAANTAINQLREDNRLNFTRITDNIEQSAVEEEVDIDQLDADTISRLIEALPENYRLVFNLFAIEEYSHREISKMLGISESLSATQYSRAKSALRKIILKEANR